jgi:hypothetical protein
MKLLPFVLGPLGAPSAFASPFVSPRVNRGRGRAGGSGSWDPTGVRPWVEVGGGESTS